MNKYAFMAAVRERLGDMPHGDIERSLEYYSEMIDDRIEEGFSEEEAVAAMGEPEDVAAQIISEKSYDKSKNTYSDKSGDGSTQSGNKACLWRKRKFQTWEIVLLLLGIPVWLPLLAVAAVIALSVYIVVWTAVIVFYAADLCLAVFALVGLATALSLFMTGSIPQACMALGFAFLSAGGAILAFFACNAVVKAVVFVTKKAFKGIKSLVIGRKKNK